MYDPPRKDHWHSVSRFTEPFIVAYDKGYLAAKEGKNQNDNPYDESGHERDTTFQDMLHEQWYSGFNDYEGDEV